MSNQVATFNMPTTLPANIASMMMGNLTASSDSFGDGFNRISFGGRTFHLKSGSAETEWETRTIDVSLVASAPNDSRVFYREAYDAKANEVTPTCWATDGVEPDATVPTADKQSDTCDTCPQNVKGSGQGDSRACSRRRRVVLIVEDDADRKLYTADISASSIYAPRETKLGLFNWKDCVKQINTMVRNTPGIIPTNFLLQMSFTNDTVPIVQFSFRDQRAGEGAPQVRASSMQTVNAAVAAWESGEAKRLIEMPVATGESNAAAGDPRPTTEPVPNIPVLGVSEVGIPVVEKAAAVPADIESDDLMEL